MTATPIKIPNVKVDSANPPEVNFICCNVCEKVASLSLLVLGKTDFMQQYFLKSTLKDVKGHFLPHCLSFTSYFLWLL